MRKGRFWYLLITSILTILIVIFTFFYSTKYDIYLYIACILAYIPNFTFRKSERDQLLAIVSEYAQNCDSNRYFNSVKDYYNSLYLSKRARRFTDITLATILIDMGDFKTAENMLIDLKDIIDKASSLNRYSYFRALSSLYYEKGEAKHYEIILNEMRKILDNERNPNIHNNLVSNFRHVEAKYFIMNGIYLDKARSVYEEILALNTPPVMRISANYYLGVISIKENKRDKALEYFKKVAFSDKNLYLVTKAMKYVEAFEI